MSGFICELFLETSKSEGPKEHQSFQSFPNFLWKTSKLRKLVIYKQLVLRSAKLPMPPPLILQGPYNLGQGCTLYESGFFSTQEEIQIGEVAQGRERGAWANGSCHPHILRSLKGSTAPSLRLALLFFLDSNHGRLGPSNGRLLLSLHVLSEYTAGQSRDPALKQAVLPITTYTQIPLN